jgi:drug/metabolite transporter (DMT)-like permease
MKGLLSRLWRLIRAGSFPTACALGCILSPLRGYGAISSLSQQRAPSSSSLHISVLYTWSAILVIVFASVVGDVLLARAMKQVGDVGALWRSAGLGVVIGRTLGNPLFLFGVTAMAVAFFSLLFALSWGDVSLVAPAAASLTFIGNAIAAKIFLHEKVDRRRWIAASLVAAGVALLAG